MHDIADLERRGIPSVFVATVQFVDGAEVQGKALGFDPAAVWVEHPIQDRTDDEMVAIADKAFDELIEQLVAA
ncbi:MAG: hypothetical protein OXF61_05545 [Acidimicrobiaceae bacterium]|nr:hypothetical protein [Acidimicrobiaceae bacterium]MXV88885.1 hypothetical protein [Acidimicrobiales bacterium]MCY3609094.1 hypothetical protein [Acidimicrobiaceae bacterium]MCY3948649.1 hypothetical protein [Acidimicrobiaceae bacterium]MDE0136655.1 hypothetical protein [Acidimicrobiaceae bacterium]